MQWQCAFPEKLGLMAKKGTHPKFSDILGSRLENLTGTFVWADGLMDVVADAQKFGIGNFKWGAFGFLNFK